MPLMPADVRTVTFSKPPVGKRGYRRRSRYLPRPGSNRAGSVDRGEQESRNQVEQLDQQRRAAPVDTGKNLRPVGLLPGRVIGPIRPPIKEQTSCDDDHNVHAAKVLGLAQEMAERLTNEAKAEADGMLSKAHATSAQLLSEARAKAEGMVTGAKTRAETMLNDARTKAETLDRQSRDKAASLEREAASKHTEILGSINQEKSVLEEKINELGVFEREYRTRLKTYLQSQLQELDGSGPAAPADPMSTQQDLVTSGSGARAEPPGDTPARSRRDLRSGQGPGRR